MSCYDVGSQYEGGMRWDSREGTVGMSIIDARGEGYDEYTQRFVDELTTRDKKIASSVIAIVNNEAA